MSTEYENDRQEKLKRMPLLRVFNAIGMISWKQDQYSTATQYLRVWHPLSWLWMLITLLYCIGNGIVNGFSDWIYAVRNEISF